MSNHRTIWWLNPAVPLAIPAGASAAMAWLLPAADFELHWKTWKFFGAPHLAITLAAIGAFLLGVAASSRFVSGETGDEWTSIDPSALGRLLRAATALAAGGYAIWYGAAVSRGMTLDSVLGVFRGDKGAVYEMKEVYMVTVSGLSTLTQFGVAGIALAGLAAMKLGWRRVAAPAAILFGLAFIRSVLNSERLAVVELAVPGAVAFLLMLPARWRTGPRWTVIRFAPVVAPVLLFAFFTASEYFRSWSNHYAGQGGSLLGFGAIRLSGYYLTAVNNSAFLFDRIGEPLGVPYFAASALYRFPVISELARAWFLPLGAFAGSDLTPEEMFANGANPEFNNPGGMLLPFLDFGVPIGILYWLCAGLGAGILYSLAVRRHAAGLCLYPVIYLSLLETPRIIYWSEGRFVPAWILLCGAAWWMSRSQRRAQARHAWLRQREGAWA